MHALRERLRRGRAQEAPAGGAAIELQGIRKRYEGAQVLESVDLTVQRGEFVCLLGPSGCGKTTTLNVIAGFVEPDSGTMLLDGRRMDGTPPHRRHLGMVFQRYTLFPHMTMFDNVAFGLRIRRVPRAEIQERVEESLALVGLSGLGRRYASELSGGQQQRAALARALVVKPSVLLYDEPLSSLDALLRREMQVELRRIHEEQGLTSIYVTHDQEEALVMSDRIVVLHDGRIEQDAPPEAVYRRPRTRFVAEFLGDCNILTAVVVQSERGAIRAEIAPGWTVTVGGVDVPPAPGSLVTLGIREEHVGIEPVAAEASVGTVRNVIYRGSSWRYYVGLHTGEIRATHVAGAAAIAAGEAVALTTRPEHWFVLES